MILKVRKAEKDDRLITQEEIRDQETPTWKPISLRLPFLTFVLLATCALIVVLQWLLYKSQTDGGVIFAPNIDDLPLSKTFGYLYAPTIVAVIYGLLWSWVDLDIKRMEPYYQLCSTGGALAEDSLLLQYPFDFIALVPFQAARRKHWSVFTGGLAGIVILWTLTPLQAGIFATEDRVVTNTISFLTSTAYQPASNQTEPSALYAQHAYNIAWLNEALPPYSTVDFVLDAFAPAMSYAVDDEEIWNAATKLYSVDVVCEPTINYIVDPDSDNPSTMYNSSNGCSYGLPVKTGTGNDTSKVLEAMYVGYSDQNGMADWYLEGYCPKKTNHTFLVRTTLFTEAGIIDQNLESTTTPDKGVVRTTSLYCEPQYFVQQVNASVTAANGSVMSVIPVGQKSQLPQKMFDINLFERAMSSGLDYRGPGVSYDSGRGDFPENAWPDQKTHFVNTNLDMSYLPKMVPFSFAALKKPSLEEYLDPKTLAESYQAAYRLLFVAQMARVLKSDSGTTATHHDGQRTYHTQALVLVPGFTYAVEALNVTMNWQGGTTKDEFYIAMSNALASSKLPLWTDPDRFYLPVTLPGDTQAGINYTISTEYFGASLGCQELTSWETKDIKDESGSIESSLLEFNIMQPDGSITNCSIDFSIDPPAYISGPSSLEISAVAGFSEVCKENIVAGWWRGNASNRTVEVTSKTMMLCRPQLVTGSAEVTVDPDGRILHSKILGYSNGSAPEYFTTDPSDLILQAHQYIIDHSSDWHNDSFPSDWNNYLIAETFIGDRFLDPQLPAPTFNQAVTIYTAMYNKLFAILLGNNAHLLFTAPHPTTKPLPALRHEPQTRIFLSLPAFVIAECILCLYVLTTVLVYLHRPWRILPRLPISLASTIAFFAASHAIQEFEGV
ncbi:hypothetical protein KCU99_g6909, partial [Aureobasidium melanogenum]